MTTIQQYSAHDFLKEIEDVPAQHLPQLYQLIQLYKESLDKTTNLESFEISWKQALNGETMNISELWDDIDVE